MVCSSVFNCGLQYSGPEVPKHSSTLTKKKMADNHIYVWGRVVNMDTEL